MRKQSRDPRVAPILDPTQRALILATTAGHLVHETPAASALLAGDPDSDRVRKRASAIARSSAAAPDSVAAREWTDSHRHCEIATSNARYALFAVPAGRHTFSDGATIVIDIERLHGASLGAIGTLASHVAALVEIVERLRAALIPRARST